MTAGSVEQDLARAARHHQAGEHAAAERIYRRILAAAPRHPIALHRLGILALQAGDAATAAVLLTQAAEADPTDAGAVFNLGIALRALGRLEEAAARYRQAIGLAPGFADAHTNLGNLLRVQGRPDEALACYARAVQIAPGNAGAHNNLGTVLQDLRRHAEAEAAHRRALALRPDHAGAHGNLGNALVALGRIEEAITSLRAALALQPAYVDGWINLAAALKQKRDLPAAADALEQALVLQPDHAEALSQLVHLRQELCRWDGLAAAQARLLRLIDAGGIVTPFTLLSLPSTPAEQQRCARAWVARKIGAQPRAPTRAAGAPRADADPRIQVGYLSSDFREHPVGYLIAELLERHDRARFRIRGYGTGPNDGGPYRQRIAAALDPLTDLHAASDLAIARRIAEDEIDILVDLNGLTGGGRPAVMAFRPAPIQVNYLGYPGTMGGDFVDYAVVDRTIVPPDEQAWFDERLVHLPDSYQATDSRRPPPPAAPSRVALGLPERGFVFCCFSSSYKITPGMFEIWMRLLDAMPGSVLWLLEYGAETTANLRREAAARSIDPDRLVFAPSVPLPVHLARLPQADLLLDTLPYGAHTTGTDALWSGVPLLTCLGTSFPGRVGASLLRALGLPELVTDSRRDYEAMALALARDPARLAALRARLQRNRTTHPLFDGARFVRHLEAAFEAMMAPWRAGQPPAPIMIDAPTNP